MPLEEKNNTEFSLFEHSYSIPTEESLFTSTIVKAELLESLHSFDKRLQQHEDNFQKDKQALLDKLDKKHEDLRQTLAEEFKITLAAELKTMKMNANEYFSAINKHCTDLCLETLKRLRLDISSEDKVRALVSEIAATHQDQRDVELHLPRNCTLSLEEFDVPPDWTIIKDEVTEDNVCRLELDFGEVVGDFDKSFNIILSMIADQQ